MKPWGGIYNPPFTTCIPHVQAIHHLHTKPSVYKKYMQSNSASYTLIRTPFAEELGHFTWGPSKVTHFMNLDSCDLDLVFLGP